VRKLNVFAAFSVNVAAVYVSVSHTYDLFRSVGFVHYHAIAGTYIGECMFVVGGLNISYSRLRNRKPSTPGYLGFYFGLALVAWSNVAATFDYGIKGWLLSAAIVCAVLITEGILTAETQNSHKDTNESHKDTHEDEHFTRDVDRFAHDDDQVTHHDDLFAQGKIALNEMFDEITDKHETPHTGEIKEVETMEKDGQELAHDCDHGADVFDHDEEEIDHVKEVIDREEAMSEPIEDVIESDDLTLDSATSHESHTEHTEECIVPLTDYNDITERAYQYERENGKLPSIRDLVDYAPCSFHRARKVRNNIDKERAKE
jgi:hypothetical protein